MKRCWIAVTDERPADADAAAPLADEAGAAGWLAAWHRASKPLRQALRADPRMVDPAGEQAWISIVLPARELRLAFDDLAVQSARRRVLSELPPDAVTTLLADDVHFAGSLTVRRGLRARALLRDDPFGRVLPARVLHLGAGFAGTMPAPCGPSIERHGSDQPWPWDHFPA